MSAFIVGLDLGQSQDFSALSVVEKLLKDGAHQYHVRHLQRFPLQTPYPDIVSALLELLRRPQLGPRPTLAVDKTGVGAPVVDLLRCAHLKPYEIIVHGGAQLVQQDREVRLPKRDLIAVLQVLLETDALRVAQELPDTPQLLQEILEFKLTCTDRGHDRCDHPSRGHDDLLMSLALALWVARHLVPVNPIQPYTTVQRRVFAFKGTF